VRIAGCLSARSLAKKSFSCAGDGAGVGDRLRDILEEWLVLLDPVAGALLPRMKVANDVIPDQCPVRLFDIEVKNARPFVIDPDDGVVMIGHCGLLARINV
jgi:hypothetical protein